MEVWTFATSSCTSDKPVVRARSGKMQPSSTPRTCAGGGFRLAPPSPHSPASSSPSSRPGTAPERRTPVRGAENQGFVAMSMKVKGLVPTFPNGAQAVPKRRALEVAGEKGLSRKKEQEVLSLSEQYIRNLQLQISILEKEREIADGDAARRLRSAVAAASSSAAASDAPGAAAPRGLAQVEEKEERATVDLNVLSTDGVVVWLEEIFSRTGVDSRIARHRESVVQAFRENEITGVDLVGLEMADLRSELQVSSLAVRKFLLREIVEAGRDGRKMA